MKPTNRARDHAVDYKEVKYKQYLIQSQRKQQPFGKLSKVTKAMAKQQVIGRSIFCLVTRLLTNRMSEGSDEEKKTLSYSVLDKYKAYKDLSRKYARHKRERTRRFVEPSWRLSIVTKAVAKQQTAEK